MTSEVWELFRFVHPDGSSKDWAIAVINGEIGVRFNSTGKRMRKQIVGRRFTDLRAEYNRRTAEKRRGGYVYVGRCHFDARHQPVMVEGNPDPTAETQPDVEPDDRTVFFEIRAPSESDVARFTATCHEACAKLRETGVIRVDVQRIDDAVVFSIGRWSFEVADSASRNPNALLRSNRTGGGRIRAEAGVYPFLFLAYLKRHAPREFEVNLAWNDGIEVTDQLHHEAGVLALFGATLDGIRPVAVALGLAEERIDLTRIGRDASLYF